MPGNFKKATLQRRLRHLGNKNKVAAGHPQGNKPSFAGGGTQGRAAASQFASAKKKNPFQKGAPPAAKKAGPGIKPGTSAGPPAGIAKDMAENVLRNRSSMGPFGMPAIKRRMGPM